MGARFHSLFHSMSFSRFVFLVLGLGAALSISKTFADEPPPPAEPAVEAAAVAREPESREEESALRVSVSPQRRGRSQETIFRWGRDAILPAGQRADDVVALFATTRAEGHVDGNAVAIFGPVILGETGSADGNAVAVLGRVRIDGPVEGNVVSVLGGVTLGPKARVDGNVVSVGAPIEVDPAAVVVGNVVEAASFVELPELGGLHAWVRHALLLGRPLTLHPETVWAWGVAGFFFMLYLFIALAMGGGLVKCAETLERRPGKTVLASFLAVVLLPLLLVVLLVTVVGAPLLILVAGVLSLVGKAAFLCWLGRRVLLPAGVRHAVPAVLAGGLMLGVLYLVPFLGFAVMKATDAIGLGMVLYTLMLAGSREKVNTAGVGDSAKVSGGPEAGAGKTFVPPPPQPSPPPVRVPGASAAATTQDVSRSDPMDTPMPLIAVPVATSQPTWADESAAGGAPAAGPVPVASAMPRAGFGRRLGALLIDAMLVFAFGLVTLNGPGPLVPIMAVYLVVLWALKGTTVGGIICGLKIVRLDDRPVDWTTALVRGLAGFVSIFPAGLGFLWMVFDEEKQAWHDKVAGTVVVRAPQGMSLV